MKKFLKPFIGLSCNVIFVILIFYMMFSDDRVVEKIPYENGWEVSVNGSEFEKVDVLPEYKMYGLKRNDYVVLRNTLPECCEKNQTMEMLQYLSAVDAYVDGEQVYNYGHEALNNGDMVGSGYHFISIPADSQGKTIVIRMELGEDNAFTNVPKPVLIPSELAYVDYGRDHFCGLIICMFLVLLGVILMCLSAIAIKVNRIMIRLVYIGSFSFLVGIWSMCNMKILQLFQLDFAVTTTLEYISLYIAPIPFMLLIMEMCKDEGGWRYYLMRSVVLLMTTFAVIANALHYSGAAHYPNCLTYFHMFGALSMIVVLIVGISAKKTNNNADKMLVLGIIVLVISIGYDLVRFNLQKYVAQENEFLSHSIIPIGGLLFIVFLILSYASYVYTVLVYNAEKEWLTYRAYTDQLCDINNRAKSTEVFDEIDSSEQRIVYEIINLDLNGLKKVNDTLGHGQGDVLLKEFAEILKNAFDGVGEAYRMGGDEFIVIVYEENFGKVNKALEIMGDMQRKKSAELPFDIEVSYGIARSDEKDLNTSSKVYAEADARMYEMKSAIKRRRKMR
ncbi:MAG: GGDEF domain-containing protein [Lachnospiraceae bacterium]|nr:GGDEF domain-containing protein [Lachnospiraceae bacterium]